MKPRNPIFTTLVVMLLSGLLEGKQPRTLDAAWYGPMGWGSFSQKVTDDQGKGDLSCLGNAIFKTPHIDRFYEKATRFTDFHVSPSCAPTRAALMSGRHAFRVGVTHTIMKRERMALDVLTLPQALQSAGYATGIFGKWHLGDDEPYLPHNRGFDESLIHGAGGAGQTVWGDFPANGKRTYYDSVLLHNNAIVRTKGFCTDLFFNAGLSWIKEQHVSKRPYCAYISTNAPHTPFIVPEKYTRKFTEMGWKNGRADPAGRFGMIENIDENFGMMMQELDGRSLLPLLKDPEAEWADRELFVHVGRWEAKHPQAKDVPSAQFFNCAVRTERWRFVNNAELYDISADPGETTDVSASHPEVIEKLRNSYDAWWDKTVPLMVNEDLTTQRVRKNYPLAVRYKKQLAEEGIPDWVPAEYR